MVRNLLGFFRQAFFSFHELWKFGKGELLYGVSPIFKEKCNAFFQDIIISRLRLFSQFFGSWELVDVVWVDDLKIVIELEHVFFHVKVIELWGWSLGELFEKGKEAGLKITGKQGVDFVRSGFFDVGIASKKVLDEG